MRFYRNPQGKLGEINISEIKLDKKSQDDVPRILIGFEVTPKSHTKIDSKRETITEQNSITF